MALTNAEEIRLVDLSKNVVLTTVEEQEKANLLRLKADNKRQPTNP